MRRDAEFGGEIEGRLLSFSCLRLLPLLVCACAFGVHPDRQNVPECAMSVAHSKMTKRTQFRKNARNMCRGQELREVLAQRSEVGTVHPLNVLDDQPGLLARLTTVDAGLLGLTVVDGIRECAKRTQLGRGRDTRDCAALRPGAWRRERCDRRSPGDPSQMSQNVAVCRTYARAKRAKRTQRRGHVAPL